MYTTTLNLEKRASDSALYEDLNTEYNKLRDEITKMSIDPEIEPKIKNSQWNYLCKNVLKNIYFNNQQLDTFIFYRETSHFWKTAQKIHHRKFNLA